MGEGRIGPGMGVEMAAASAAVSYSLSRPGSPAWVSLSLCPFSNRCRAEDTHQHWLQSPKGKRAVSWCSQDFGIAGAVGARKDRTGLPRSMEMCRNAYFENWIHLCSCSPSPCATSVHATKSCPTLTGSNCGDVMTPLQFRCEWCRGPFCCPMCFF